jgi:hypothetical protein
MKVWPEESGQLLSRSSFWILKTFFRCERRATSKACRVTLAAAKRRLLIDDTIWPQKRSVGKAHEAQAGPTALIESDM